MQSFVDATIEAKNIKGKSIGINRYTGDELAKKYILQGGTLFINENGSFLREGVLGNGAVYGGDIDKVFSTQTTQNISIGGKQVNTSDIYSDRPFGIRPMSGILSIMINNKSAYGSLREATVKYFCWDKHQLEELELLYMRVGYSVLLEWGWSQYLNYDTGSLSSTNLNNIDFSSTPITTETFNSSYFIDAFDPKLPSNIRTYGDDYLYITIDDKITRRRCNYDAMYGIIKNFSWQLLPNGGYECTTILISKGEVISSLRLSNNGDAQISGVAASSQEEPPLTTFEKIFYNLQAALNSKELSDPLGAFYIPPAGGTPPPTPTPVPIGFQTDQIVSATSTIILNKIAAALGDNKNLGEFRDSNGKIYKPYLIDPSGKDLIGVTTFIQGSSLEGTGNEYISLNLFIYILNTFFTLKDETDDKQSIVKFVLPQSTPILASRNSVSIDPTTCLIKNSKATLVTADAKGFVPHLYAPDGTQVGDTNQVTEFLLSNSNNLGDLGAIYVSINKLITLFNNNNNGPDGVVMVDLIQTLMDEISAALGGINDFKVFIDKGQAQIFDAKYLENDNDSKISTKFQFDLFGLKSICRDVRITSRIFEEQATMIAIGAQNGGNLGDIYSLTYNYLNQGLQDRLHPAPLNASINVNKIATLLYPDLRTLGFYLKNKCIGDPLNDLSGGTIPYVRGVNLEEIPTAASIYKTFQMRISNEDIDYKDLIPFELEITLDGMAGFVQVQIFRLDNAVLPRDYINKNVGFIITGITHNLQNNDWTTTLKTQICLLDQKALADQNPNKGLQAKLEKAIEKLQKIDKQNNILWSAYADYLTFLMIGLFKFKFAKTNADVISGNYVKSTEDGQDKDQASFAQIGFTSDTQNDFDKFIANKGNYNVPYQYFQTYYEKVWHPAATASTTLSTGDKALIPSPTDLKLNSTNISDGWRYQYYDVDTDSVQIGSLYINLDSLVINGGNLHPDDNAAEILASDIGSRRYTKVFGDQYDARGTWGTNVGFGRLPTTRIGTFLTRTDRPGYSKVGEDASSTYVTIPVSSFTPTAFKAPIPHPAVKVSGPSALIDTGLITLSGSNWTIDVNKIHASNVTYIRNVGIVNRGTSVMPDAINPQFTNFLPSIELERTKANPSWVTFVE